MNRLLIVIVSSKPVPAVKNGAIEVRVENIIKYNEAHHRYDITIASIYDKEALAQSKKYKNTKFWYIKNSSTWEKKLYSSLKKIIRKLTRYRVTLPVELYQLKFLYKLWRHKNEFDMILVENVVPVVENVKKISKVPVYLHLGNDFLNVKIPRAESISKCLSKIFVVSDYIGNQVKKISGVVSEKVVKINQGIDMSIFNKEPSCNRKELRKQFGIREDDVVYVFYGRISPEKGVKELVEAFTKLKYYDVKLMIIGSKNIWNKNNDYINEIKALASEIKEKIVFTDEVPHDQLADYLNAADVAVLPPLWEEPASQAVLESMVSGLPLITTDSGGISEYCDRNASYILLRDENLIGNIAAAMTELYLNPSKRLRMGKIAKEFGKIFTAERHVEMIFNALN